MQVRAIVKFPQVLEHILLQELNTLSLAQSKYGFRKYKSTTTSIIPFYTANDLYIHSTPFQRPVTLSFDFSEAIHMVSPIK